MASLMATPLSLQWWIGIPSYPLPRRQPSSWCNRSSGSMDFRLTWSPIAVLSSRLGSARRSAPSLGCRPAFPPVFAPSLMASGSEPIRTWRRLFLPRRHQPHHLEPATCAGRIHPQLSSLLGHSCCRTWRVRSVLLKTTSSHRTPAPCYHLGKRVRLSTRDLPLRVQSRKLSPCFISPFPISKILSPTAVGLVLPSTLRIHLTFHASRTKPLSHSRLSPVIPCVFIPAFSVCLLPVRLVLSGLTRMFPVSPVQVFIF
jgi:hypothetical protein